VGGLRGAPSSCHRWHCSLKFSNFDTSNKKKDVSYAELETAVLSMGSHKAPGYDHVRPQYVQIALPELAAPLLHLFNSVLQSLVWPAAWRCSIICPIPKPGLDARSLDNTRPISLQPVLARILSAILAERLQSAVAPLLHSCQAGFLRNRSTAEHLLTMRLCLEQQPASLQVLLLDIAKAYDTVSWARLDAALQRVHCPAAFRHLVQSMLAGSSSQVRTAWGLSDAFQQRRGVLQGSPLSWRQIYSGPPTRARAGCACVPLGGPLWCDCRCICVIVVSDVLSQRRCRCVCRHCRSDARR
jgi:hypothetical protein